MQNTAKPAILGTTALEANGSCTATVLQHSGNEFKYNQHDVCFTARNRCRKAREVLQKQAAINCRRTQVCMPKVGY